MRSRSSGFTLIELILVMLIVVVVMAVTAPSMRDFLYGRKTANAVNQIVSLAHHGRSKAIVEGRTYRMSLEAASGTFWLDAQDGGDFKELGTESGQRFDLPEGTKAAWVIPEGGEPREFVRFYADGRCEPGTLTITGSQGEKIELGAPSESELWHVLSQ